MRKSSTIKFGIIGSATVLEYGFMPAVNMTDGVEAIAIGSRDIAKAKLNASKYGIPKAYGSYEALLKDPEVNCIYVPLPNSMHIEWARKALKAGKHVLCEKPAAWTTHEAKSIRGLIEKSGLIFAEAFQYRYHPLLSRVKDIVDSGRIGKLVKVEASYCEIIENRKAAQFQPEMAGGALMDEGCYCVDFCRFIAGYDTAEVTRVKSKLVNGVDGETRADLLFSNGVEATVICSIIRTTPCYAVVAGTKGTIFIHNVFPAGLMVNGKVASMYLCILRTGNKIQDVIVPVKFTYGCQIEAFRDAVRSGKQPITNIGETVSNMVILDDIREKAGVSVPYKGKK
jgi:D-xylose 1-dehydrogenase (NADP+, D-xylono-1,5-lactone-forming)